MKKILCFIWNKLEEPMPIKYSEMMKQVVQACMIIGIIMGAFFTSVLFIALHK
jgi:hypothetical protein